MKRLVPLGLWMSVGAALLSAPIQIRQSQSPPDNVVLEIWLKPEVGAEVILTEVKLQILESGGRIFSYYSDFAGPGSRSLVFLADPVSRRYQTAVFLPLAENDEPDLLAAPDEARRVWQRLGPADWSRLPSYQQISRPQLWIERGPKIRSAEPRRGLVWAESRVFPGYGDGPPGAVADGCQGSHSVSMRLLGAPLISFTNTQVAVSWENKEGLESVAGPGSFCRSAEPGRFGSHWTVDSCVSVFERYAGSLGRASREVRYLNHGSSPDAQRRYVSQYAEISRSSDTRGSSSLFLSHTDWEPAALVILGAITEKKLDSCS